MKIRILAGRGTQKVIHMSFPSCSFSPLRQTHFVAKRKLLKLLWFLFVGTEVVDPDAYL